MNLTIRTRLIIAFVVLIGIMGFIYNIGSKNAEALNSQIDEIISVNVARAMLTGKVAEDIQYITKREKDLILSRDKSRLQELSAEIDQRQQEMDGRLEKIRSLEDEKGLEAWDDFDAKWSDYRKAFKKIRHLTVNVMTDSSSSLAYGISSTEAREAAAETASVITKLNKKTEAGLKEINIVSTLLFEEGKTFMLTSLIIAIAVAGAMAFWIIGSIVNSLNQANKVLKSVAAGDLTVDIEIKNKDEIGILLLNLRGMVEKLKEVISSVTSAADNIASASEQMSGSSQQMSEGSTEQAASAEEVSSSMEEMAANIQQNTDNAQQTEKIALQAADDVQEGSKAVNQTVDSMKKIAEKISIIGEIARQTNLLALNAAVEAARAGEHGKGFAVVAAEVRRLAERSQVAANEINELSSSSVAIADKSGKLLEQIVPNIQKTSRLVQEISAASMEQNAGAEQVNNAIQQLNQVIQQNAAGAEEMASSSEELSSQAEQLKDTISYFNVGNNSRNFNSTNHKIRKKQPVPVVQLGGNTFIGKRKIEPSKTGLQLDLNGHDNLDADFEKY